MSTEKDSYEFRALDFTEDDILFSPLVRYHFEMEAMEDLQKLDAGSFENAPEEASSAQKRAEKYFQKEEVFRTLRKGYYALQKIAVILVVLFIGFAFLTVQVDAVKKNVIKWLQDTNPSYTTFSFYNDGDTITDRSTLQIGWYPENCVLDDSNKDMGLYSLRIGEQEIADIWYLPTSTTGNIDTEDATITYLNLEGFTKVMLIEKDTWHGIQATTNNAMILTTTTNNDIYTPTIGEMLCILQNLDFKEK